MPFRNAKRRAAAVSAVCDPPLADWPDQGVYQLRLRVSVAVRVRVGRLGTFRFPAGRYVYTGRAARGLRARVLRHLRRGGRQQVRFWHIDYLLARPEVHVERVVLASPRPADECAETQALGGRVVAAGFGASDCRRRCGAHLRWLAHGSRVPGPAPSGRK